MISPYKVVPGTDIVHSTTDVYELYDEAEGITYRVELQADNGGVSITYTETKIDEKSKLFNEYMSIANKELAVVIAKRILEIYQLN